MSKVYSRLYSRMLKYFKESEEYTRCLIFNSFPSQIPVYKNSKYYKNGLYFMELVSDKRYNLYCDLKFLLSSSFKDSLLYDGAFLNINEINIISNELNLINQTFYLDLDYQNLPIIKSSLDLSSHLFVLSYVILTPLACKSLQTLNVSFEGSVSLDDIYDINLLITLYNFVLSKNNRLLLTFHLVFTFDNISQIPIFLESFFSNLSLSSFYFHISISIDKYHQDNIPIFIPSGIIPVYFTEEIVLDNYGRAHLIVDSDNNSWRVRLDDRLYK